MDDLFDLHAYAQYLRPPTAGGRFRFGGRFGRKARHSGGTISEGGESVKRATRYTSGFQRVGEGMDLILPGLAKCADGVNTLLQQEFGFTGDRAGADIVIKARDAARGFRPREFLRLRGQMDLAALDDAATAQQLMH